MRYLTPTRLFLSVVIGLVVLARAKGEEHLQDRFDRIAKKVGPVAGIELTRQVAVERITRDEYRKILRRQMESVFPKNRLHGLQRSGQLLGLLPEENFDAGALFDLAVATAGGAYNPETKSIQLMHGPENDGSDEDVFHELVHGAQDQRYDMTRTVERLGMLDSTDAILAYRFLVEGEAMFWPMLYRRQMTLEHALRLPPESETEIFGDEKPLTSQQMVRNFEQNAQRDPRRKALASAMKLLPPVMVRLLSLPYAKGDNAVLRILKRGGRQALWQSFEDLPNLNTRDMLFPDSKNEKPRGVTKVQLASVKEQLGNPWQLKHDDTMGALVLHTMFENRENQATEIARCWNGDRIQLWEDEGDGVVLLGLVEFETPVAAKLFETELIRVCREEWMREKTIRELESNGTHLAAGGEHFVLEQRGRSVVFLRSNGCKDAALVASTLWKGTRNQQNTEKRDGRGG